MTGLPRFRRIAALALSLVACTGPEPTSLEGDIACGSMTCGDGQLCETFEPHPGEALQYSCVTVTPGCEVFDCVSDERSCPDCEICPACIVGHCGYLTRVENRELMCLGF